MATKPPKNEPLKVGLTLVEELLGTASNNPEVHKEHIASKSADAEKVKEEMEALSAEELIEKSVTVFPKENGVPFLWDYQIRGFFKENIGAFIDLGILDYPANSVPRLTKWVYKRIVDKGVFVNPRKVMLNMPTGSKLGNCPRPIRVLTMKGERVALADSETVPPGTWLEFEVVVMVPTLLPVMEQCLDYGKLSGLGQWRGGGKGRFTWKNLK